MGQKVYGDLLVVDLGLGMAPALVAKFFAESGARIVRIEPSSGDPFYDVYPAYGVWRRHLEVESEAKGGPARLSELLAKADLLIVGGEDFPGLKRRTDIAAIAAANPRLVILNIEGYPETSSHAGRPASDILVQARSGLAYEHYSSRPTLMGFEPSAYGAALQGLVATFGALYEREASGKGQIATTSLYLGAITWACSFWVEMEKPTPAANFVMPLDPWPLIFRCKDGKYIHVVMGSAGSKGGLYRILEVDDPSVDINDSGMPMPGGDPKYFFGDIDVLAEHIAKKNSQDLINAIIAAGLPAGLILEPGELWDTPQVIHNGLITRDADGTRYVGNPVQATLSPAPRRPVTSGKGPLSGLRVIDFGAYVAGPYCSVLLGDLGADVIKVENTAGDPNRAVFRSFSSANRGKRTISLDLKSPEGLEIAHKLCSSADVVTNNFRTGVSARLGVDAASLHKMKPELIVLESAAYGSSGPLSNQAGFDMVFQALCGHEFRAGGVGNPPAWNRTSMVDYAGGLLGATAIMEYLFGRARTGAGASLGVALMNGGIFLLSELIQMPDGKFTGAPQLNHGTVGYHPAEQMYETADGWIAIAARGDAMTARLVELLDVKITAPRAAWGDGEAALIAAAVRGYKRGELLAKLAKADIWAEACVQNAEHATLNDPALEAAGFINHTTHPQFGEMRELGPQFSLSRSTVAARGPAPVRSEQTQDILAELGFSGADIESLLSRKIVR